MTVEIDALYDHAVTLHRQGALDQACTGYADLLRQVPGHAAALHLLGFATHQLGDSARGLEHIERALALEPDMIGAQCNRGVVLLALGQPELALEAFDHALTLQTDFFPARFNRGLLLLDQECFADAEGDLLFCAQANPDPSTLVPLARALLGQEKLGPALECCGAVLAQEPMHLDTLDVQAEALGRAGQIEQQLEVLRLCAELEPSAPERHARVGQAHGELGQLNEALDAYDRALRWLPEWPEVLVNAGIVLMALGRTDQALDRFQAAAAAAPELPTAHHHLGVTLLQSGRFDRAANALEAALRLDPRHAGALAALGEVRWRQGHLQQAVDLSTRAVALDPTRYQAHNTLGCVRKDRSDMVGALQHFQDAQAAAPTGASAHSNVLLSLAYLADHDPQRIVEEAHRWVARHAPSETARPTPPAPSGPLRVGVVSGNLRTHPHGFFAQPLFEHHDPDAIELFVYSDFGGRDPLTERLKHQAAQWCDSGGLTDDALTERIRQDGVHVLFDLSRHTGQHRLGVFARRAAPVQVTWLGGPQYTSALPTMDAFLTDRWHVPPHRADAFTEHVVALDRDYICFQPPEYTPDVTDAPSTRGAPVTFGSFNNLCKLTDTVLHTWAQILDQVPGSRLLLRHASLDDPATRAFVLQRLADQGVPAARVLTQGQAPHPEFLAGYGQVDVALDPFPYGGGLTTCEALWMGVPVVSLRSAPRAVAHSTSHLENAGVGWMLADTLPEYVARAVALARSPDRAALRHSLRAHVAASPLCDGPGFAAAFQDAVATLWHARAVDAPIAPPAPRPRPSVQGVSMGAAPQRPRPGQGRRPRVLVAVQEYPQISETYIASEIEALWPDHEVHILTFTEPDLPYAGHRPYTCLPLFDDDDRVVQENLRAISRFVAQVAPDVVHGHYLHLAPVLQSLAQMADCPYTVRAHSFDILGPQTARIPDMVPLLQDPRCLGVLTFPFTTQWFVDAGVPEHKVVSCFPVVDVARFSDRSPNGGGVMNVGACIPKKNMKDFVRLAARDSSRPYTLYALGYAVETIAQLNRAMGTPVHVHPPVEPRDMLQHYKRNEWLVYTACPVEKTVGWPMAIAEAQAAGVGVCLQNVRPDLAELVGPAGYLFDTLDEVQEILSKPFPAEKRALGFEQAKRSDVATHIAKLTGLWAPIWA